MKDIESLSVDALTAMRPLVVDTVETDILYMYEALVVAWGVCS